MSRLNRYMNRTIKGKEASAAMHRVVRTLLMVIISLLFSRVLPALDPAKQVTQYTVDVWGMARGLPQNSVQDMIRTSDGYIWVGTQEGVARFDGVNFTVFDKHNVEQMSTSWVWDLYEDRQGHIWIATFGGGLIRMKDGRTKAYTKKNGLSGNAITSVHQGKDGSYWIGTRGDGLNRMTGEGFTAYTKDQGLSGNNVWTVFEDSGGRLWVGTEHGLNRQVDGKFVSYTTKDGLAHNWIWAVYEDSKGNILIGSDGGVDIYALGKFTSLTPGHTI